MKIYETFKVVGYTPETVSSSISYCGTVWVNRFLIMFQDVQEDFYVGQLLVRGTYLTTLPKKIRDRLKQRIAEGRYQTVPFYDSIEQQRQRLFKLKATNVYHYLNKGDFTLFNVQPKKISLLQSSCDI